MNIKEENLITLGIESSCDDTSIALLKGNKLLANLTANQKVHEEYGGVVPELASRSHLKNIVPLMDIALKKAGVNFSEIDAVAFTNGPGLLGSLLVGASYAKSISMAMGKPLIEVNHMRGHILSHFIQIDEKEYNPPDFPFLCLTVSGGHTQIVRVDDAYSFVILGGTIDDAAGEAFDKGAKILGLSYPGGPEIDKLSKLGDPHSFKFSQPKTEALNFSFSGLKTSLLYFIRDKIAVDSNFVDDNLNDICASYQNAIIEILIKKIEIAADSTGINKIALAGGVSANSTLRNNLLKKGKDRGWQIFLPEFQFCTDNAAMIAIAGYFKFLRKEFTDLRTVPFAKMGI